MSKALFFQLAFLFASVMVFLQAVTFVRQFRAKAPQRFQWRHPRSLLRAIVVTGTDADLKVEFLFLLFLVAVVWLSPPPTLLGPHWPPLVALSVLVGFTLRQWLSKWRLRNIAFLEILFTDHLFYFKSLASRSYLMLALGLCTYLVVLNPALAASAFVGFVGHEVWLESKKGRRLLRRKLHLFDLDETPLSKGANEHLLAALSRLDFRAVDRLAGESTLPTDRVLLGTFSALLRDDFEAVYRNLEEHQALVAADPRLAAYFGRALYVVGDVERARLLLAASSDADRTPLRSAYLVLASLAEPAEAFDIRISREDAPGDLNVLGQPRAKMLSDAFRALALAIQHSRSPTCARSALEEALLAIHSALQANDALLRRRELGRLAKDYFDANHQMFLDIYGYVLFRCGNLTLAFRVLQAAISTDDTYPWPYFHLALIYQRVGRVDLARALLLRIAQNERSDSVLKRLCLRRVGRIDETEDGSRTA